MQFEASMYIPENSAFFHEIAEIPDLFNKEKKKQFSLVVSYMKQLKIN